MEGMASVCGYQQSLEELQRKLLWTRLELESTLMAANEEKRRNEENVKELLQILNAAFQERDEAKNQLQRLINKIKVSTTTEPNQNLLNLQPESPPQMIPTIGNSSLTETDSLSETYNRHSHASSPVDSFLDVVSSPDLNNMNVADSSHTVLPKQPLLHEHNVTLSSGIVSSELSGIDPASAIINQIALKRTLPEKGKLLQAVMDAGPLLQTLLVAGPLPQWRNPPPVYSLQIPPVSIQGCDPMPVVPKTITNPSYSIKNSEVPCHENLSGASQVRSTAMLNFSSAVGPCMKRSFLSSFGSGGLLVDPSVITKRRRF